MNTTYMTARQNWLMHGGNPAAYLVEGVYTMDTQLATALRTAADFLYTQAQEAEISSIPRGGHFFYGRAPPDAQGVRLECMTLKHGVIVAGCPIISGTYGMDHNALSIPASYGAQPGAENGDPILVFLVDATGRKVYLDVWKFSVMGLTEMHLA